MRYQFRLTVQLKKRDSMSTLVEASTACVNKQTSVGRLDLKEVTNDDTVLEIRYPQSNGRTGKERDRFSAFRYLFVCLSVSVDYLTRSSNKDACLLVYCWNSSRYDQVSDSGRSANPNSNCKFVLCEFYFTDRVVNTVRGICRPVMLCILFCCAKLFQKQTMNDV